MTINTENRTTSPKLGDGVWTDISFTFKVFATSEVVVVETNTSGVDTTLLEGSGDDYTVVLNTDQNTNPGGVITLTSVSTLNYNYTATSAVGNLQPTNITNLGGFFPKTINNALDRLTILIQQVLNRVDRSIKIPLSDGTGVIVELPTKTVRANNVVGFDANGNVASLTFADVGADLGGVFTSLTTNDFIRYNGTNWVNVAQTDLVSIFGIESFQTGDLRTTLRATAATGWVFVQGQSIGASGSGADLEGTTYENLFTELWNSLDNAHAAVSSGRGASAAADWTAGKTLTLPDAQDAAMFAAGTTWALGQTQGSETIAQANLPAVALTLTGTTDASGDHIHSENLSARTGAGALGNLSVGSDLANVSGNTGAAGDHTHNVTGNTQNMGSGTDFLPKGLGVNIEIKL